MASVTLHPHVRLPPISQFCPFRERNGGSRRLTCLLHKRPDAQDIADRVRRGPGTGNADVACGARDPVVAAHLGSRGRHRAGIGVLVDVVVGQSRLRRRLLARLVRPGLSQTANLIAQDSTDGAHRRHVVLVADAVGQQPVSDLPRKDTRVALLVVPDVLDHVGGSDTGFAAPDGPGQDGACLVVARQDLAHAAVGYAKLPADVTGSDAQLRQLHDAQADGVGQGAAVDEHAAQLVHLAVRLLCGRAGRQ